MGKIDVEVLTGPPGCGKSHRLRQDAIQTPGRYLFFLPTIPLIREQVADLGNEASRQGVSLEIHEPHSGGGRGAVQRQLDDVGAKVAASGAQHVVAFTTHDALVRRDLSGFIGWHARIDEAPHAAQSGTISMGHSRAWFESYFDLSPVGGTNPWSNLSLKGASPSWKHIERDKLLKPLMDFIKLASSPGGVFVNTTAWAGVEEVDWWSIWTPASLRNFASIQIAGASYHTSLGAIVARQWFSDRINLIDVPIPMARTGRPQIAVHYFTKSHHPSVTFWDSSDGRRMVKAVCDYLASNVPDLGYWSGSGDVLKLMEWRAPGEKLSPRVLGQNKWRGLRKCAFLYSSRAQDDDRPLMDMFGISEDEVRIAREDEDILQFAMRGALRDPEFGDRYEVYLYTDEQADRLAARLKQSDVGDVEVIPIPEAGIMDEAFAKGRVKATHGGRWRPVTKPAVQKVLNPATGEMVFPKSLATYNRRAAKSQGKTKRRRGRPRKQP
jgi:hypothetical protein